MSAILPPPTYLSGRDFTNALCDALNKASISELSEMFQIPLSTFSTWHTHCRTGYELILRTHLTTGLSIQSLALGQFTDADREISEKLTIDRIPAFTYLQGRDFTDLLKEITNSKDYNDLSKYFEVPRSTFSTWNTHNRTGYELILRLLLAEKAEASSFVVPGGDQFQSASSTSFVTSSDVATIMHLSKIEDDEECKNLIENYVNSIVERAISNKGISN